MSTFFDLSQVAYIRVCMAYSSGMAIPDTATLANVSIKADKILDDGGGDEPTNQFDPNDADVTLRGRINSSGNAVAYADGQLVTGFIPAQSGDVFTIETDHGQTSATGGNGYTGTAACYNSAKGFITQAISPTASQWVWNEGITNGTFTVPSTWNSHDYSGTVYVRFCLAYTDIENIKIYKE